MNKTRIEWTDRSWNPIIGCLNDCFYCYARRLTQRFQKSFAPEFHPERLAEPLRRKMPFKIFVCSMSDFWGNGVDPYWREDVICKVFRYCPQHTFQILTKQPQNISEWEIEHLPENVWIGVTITNQGDSWRAKTLLNLDSKINKFVSLEPLLGPVIDNVWLFKWMIIGAMTGPGSDKHQPDPEWIKQLLLVADENKVPVFMKDNLKLVWKDWLRRDFPVEMMEVKQ